MCASFFLLRLAHEKRSPLRQFFIMTSRINRRNFLKSSTLTFGALAVSRSFGASVNDEIAVAVAGLGNKGTQSVKRILQTPGVRLAALCEPDSERTDRIIQFLRDESHPLVPTFTDYRKLVESKQVDAVVVTSPNHWHALMTIWACQAGKDVYVEKPVCHTLQEGQLMLAAAKKIRSHCSERPSIPLGHRTQGRLFLATG